MNQTVIVTGGAGFIGSALVRLLLSQTDLRVVTVDKLTYAGNLESLTEVLDNPRHTFVQADICDQAAMAAQFEAYAPCGIFHLAAESHVDRSIAGPAAFIQTNIVGTFSLLEAARRYWAQLPPEGKAQFRFQHISTDEVFGSLGDDGVFDEGTRYDPRSPYSASKAASDHLVRAWHYTYGLPVLLTNCSNNYGPYHFPEKLIPHVITKALAGEALPIYGTGGNIRDWLYVEDHAQALLKVFQAGMPGETYCVGGRAERTNLQVVGALCDLLDELAPRADGASYHQQKQFVADRPGHDQRYAINPNKLVTELGWAPKESFQSGLRKTVEWFLANQAWVARVLQP